MTLRKLRKKVSTPLTSEQLKDKIKLGTRITIPIKAKNSSFKDDKDFENPEFSSVDFGGIYSFPDVIGVDDTGKEHNLPGGTGFSFNWVAQGIGFGEFRVKRLSDGVLQVDSEGLGKEFLKKALCAMIDRAQDKSEKTN
jgi:hypothetical protein